MSSTAVTTPSLGAVPVRLLAVAGCLLAVAGGLRWAFDAGVSTGHSLVLGGLVVLVAAALLRNARGRLVLWSILVVAVFVLALALGELWVAVSVISQNSSAHPA